MTTVEMISFLKSKQKQQRLTNTDIEKLAMVADKLNQLMCDKETLESKCYALHGMVSGDDLKYWAMMQQKIKERDSLIAVKDNIIAEQQDKINALQWFAGKVISMNNRF